MKNEGILNSPQFLFYKLSPHAMLWRCFVLLSGNMAW